MAYKTILHNSVSLDGSYINFNVNMGLHYQVVGMYQPGIYLVGSKTAKSGIDMFQGPIPEEQPDDFQPPARSGTLSYWVIPDTKGILKGLLHVYRQFEFCRDVIILISGTTPTDYIQYLKERNYDYLLAGAAHVNYKEVFSSLHNKYNVSTILADTGKTLGNILLNQGLVDEISLLVHPVITGCKSKNLFHDIDTPINLKLKKHENLNNDYLWMVYEVEYI
jgi:2,5-diamino-6-(ribosylamino)-4(3H)-pyrimidinone 5'-phosphate reductase